MKRFSRVLVVLFFLSLLSNALAQGDLTPPGAPAPTMKTLDQIEPRIPITNLPYTISSPGSYYLTDSLQGFASADGITISADNVTLDLNGFALVGQPGSFSGITLTGTRLGICVRNGSVREWGIAGIFMLNSINSQVMNIRASTNALGGIYIGRGSRIVNCTVSGSAYGGIYIGDGSSAEGCVASGNGIGFAGENGCAIRGCSASENFSDGISVWGKSVISECQAFKNGTNGIIGGHGSVITKCAAAENGGDGIRVIRNCQVRDNDCLENGNFGSSGAGIHATESGNRIEGNHAAGADRGLDIDGTDNYVADNTVRGNTDNYDIAQGNQLNLLLCEVPESIDWAAYVKLAGTLRCTNTFVHGITVNSDGVTIDLAGHSLIGPGASSYDGINAAPAFFGVHVLNGKVLNWQGTAQYGVVLAGSDALVESLDVSSNYYGLSVSGGVVTRCTARKNTANGFETGETIVTDSSASGNKRYGFRASGGSEISHCTATANGSGFWADYAKIVNCTADYNITNGILAHAGSSVEGNHCSQNWGGAGIEVDSGGGNNKIDSNFMTANNWGIRVQSTMNQITRNFANGNSTAGYSISGGNDVGPMGLAMTNMNPWANIE